MSFHPAATCRMFVDDRPEWVEHELNHFAACHARSLQLKGFAGIFLKQDIWAVRNGAQLRQAGEARHTPPFTLPDRRRRLSGAVPASALHSTSGSAPAVWLAYRLRHRKEFIQGHLTSPPWPTMSIRLGSGRSSSAQAAHLLKIWDGSAHGADDLYHSCVSPS
jgi:hypothetical protein